jgi:DNA (cytosine-5)-methyltransferase 1
MSHVDSTSPVTHVSLCAGYGGIDLGLHRAIRNLRTIAVSEIEAFACANLVAKMEAGLLDPAPIWTDLKTFPWSDFRDRVDILSGGYPCQPFSAAGKRLGAEDPRHLWPHISAGIAAMRPSVCFFENVEGHISLGLSDVIEDLDRLGYRATWCVASASECGAPHQRKRVFILAYRKDERLRCWSPKRWEGQDRQERREVWHQPFGQGDCGTELALTSSLGSAAGIPRPQQGHERIAGVADHCGDERLANAECVRLTARGNNARQSQRSQPEHCCAWPSRPGEQQFAWEPPRVVGAVPAKLADFCSGDQQPGHDAAPAGGEGVGPGQQGEDADADGGSSVCGGDQEAGAVADSKKSGRISQRIAGDMDGETSPEGSRGHQLAPTIADCGDAGASEDPRLPNAQDMRLEEQSECGQQHQADGSGPSNPSGVCACEAQEGRSVEHASDWSNGEQPTEQQGRHSIGGSSEEAGAMGDATSEGPRERSSRSHDSPIQAAQCGSGGEGNGQTQSPLGRDADGPADWLDDAELYTTCDNRTDELRLLGNGVVPACAERAFRLLVGELAESESGREPANG